ncbi:Bud-site selection protein [Aspergillus egyptiacus]|nr:Bud-site selection protein [Aspergillus egyptiacus]
MPKRKISDVSDSGSDSDTAQNQNHHQAKKSGPNLKLQKTRLKAKFDLGVTSLSRALKTARGFERQKLGRRQKTAKEAGEETLGRIEREIKVLKELDLHSTAEKYLFKQLVKTKRIAESTVFVRFKQSKNIPVEGPKSTEEANVTARLFKSTPVKNVLPGIMDGMRGLFGLEPAGAAGKNNKGGKTQGKDTREDEKTKKKDTQRRGDAVDGSEEEEEQSGDEARRRDVDDMDVDAESGEEDYSHFDARLASDSEDDNSDDDGSSDAEKRHTKSHPPPRSSMSISLSPEPEPEPELEPEPKKKSKAKASTTPATSTTFLPSLMMGGYWSGSESEPEELDEQPRRKNRMGQQARRALWEKKYGARANHVKEQKKKAGKNGRDSGWDPRKGATGGDGDGGRRKFGTGSNAMAMSGKDRMQQQGKENPRGGKKAQDDKPLHPSWEAARKAKEQKATASFSGKKVVFD